MNSLIEQIYGLENLCDINQEIDDDQLHISAALDNEKPPCPGCSFCDSIFIGRKIRTLHLPPTGAKKTVLHLSLRRNKCIKCDLTWWPKLSFVNGKQRISKSFEAYTLDLLRFGTISDVASHLGVCWDTVKRIHKKFLIKECKNIDLSEIKYLSIDEFAIQKGHKYMTVVSDISTGRIVHAAKGRKAEDIADFLKSLKKKALF